jgi:hypothetical protein
MRDWIKKNPEKKRAASKRDYQKNTAARRAKADEWNRAHPGYVPPSIRRRTAEAGKMQHRFSFATSSKLGVQPSLRDLRRKMIRKGYLILP